MFVVLTIIVAIVAILNPSLTWLLAVIPGAYVAYATYITYSKAPALKSSLNLSHSEKEAWKKYHAFLRASVAAPAMARGLSLIGLVLTVVGLIFMFKGQIVEGVLALLGAGYLYLTPMIGRLNPSSSIVSHAEKGNREAIRELEALKSLREKLSN